MRAILLVSILSDHKKGLLASTIVLFSKPLNKSNQARFSGNNML